MLGVEVVRVTEDGIRRARARRRTSGIAVPRKRSERGEHMFGFRRPKKSTSSTEFEMLTLEYMDVLYGAALRLTRSPKEAEDLVQDTYLKAFRFFDTFEP